MKTSSKAIYIVGAVLIALLVALLICGIVLFIDDEEVIGSFTDENTAGYGGNLNESGDLADDPTLTPEDEDPSSVIAMRVYGHYTERVYFRYMSFGDYTGSGWTQAQEYRRRYLNQFGMNYLAGTAMKKAGFPEHTVEINALGNQYYLPYYLYAEQGAYAIQRSDVTQEGDCSYTYPVDYLSYKGGAISACAELAEEESAYRNFVYNNYLAVPEDTLAQLKNILQREARATTPLKRWRIM